ncbi:MAG: S-layer homology domain-containing protein [bacterium]
MIDRVVLRYLAGLGAAVIIFGCVPYGPVSGPAVPVPVPVPEIPIQKKLPEEMTPLSRVQVLTRGGLAVLLVNQLPTGRFHENPDIPIVVDLSGHWARKEVLNAVQLGMIPVFRNHRFLPDQAVTRGEMAQVLSGILERGGSAAVPRHISPELPADLPKDHLSYGAVRRVLEAGVMSLDANGRFSVDQPVSGMEASEYIKKSINYF